ncbi:oxysterol-binding protein-related protein 1-like [Tachypleus tridentatus]|uniref:oxysterol-binding protein-related protein 1-like n=1 Tax=Tachypleus tridentatus TaxID=6853 RepID=UPI003FD22D1A
MQQDDDDKSESSSSFESDPEDILLQSSRSGNVQVVNQLLKEKIKGHVSFDINCRGTQKSNRGWSALHLASYFGHTSVVQLLLQNKADVNVVNDTGDTPLHKAAYTGREGLLILLLANDADVFIRNGEGQRPKDVAKVEDVRKLLQAAEDADVKRKEAKLLSAAREGDLQTLNKLLHDANPPNINCTDTSGNTALHCCAYRGQKETAVLLLQCGIDSSIKNQRGQIAADLTTNPHMKQILCVQPIRKLQKNAVRFEGPLLRKSKLLGWKPFWAVLERGVFSFFSPADAATGTKRKSYKYLDEAKVVADGGDEAAFAIHFSDNTNQRFSVPFLHYQQLDREKWINALKEHIDFSTHYTKQGMGNADSDEEEYSLVPLASMQRMFQTGQAHQKLLEKQIISLQSLSKQYFCAEKSTNSIVKHLVSWQNIESQLTQVVESSKTLSASLSHCMAVFSQQEEVRTLQLKQEQEKCRVLEEALHVLAKEHHELEQSISTTPYNSPTRNHIDHFLQTECEEFYDAFEGEESPTPVVTPESANQLELDPEFDKTLTENEIFHSFPSSLATSPLPSESVWGRCRLPVPMFSRNDFSLWSILKHCIGKELSKITMPVVFNEPLSFLQRITEYMEYSFLLEKADDCDDPLDRIQYVAAFAVSALASNWERLGKPFNPLLGETYELVREDFGFRVVCEQVSHHPPVSAFHAESPHFIFHGSIHPKLKFWGKSVEIKPDGLLTVKLLRHNETYTWTNVSCCVHNIIIGKLWFEQYGILELIGHDTGLSAVMNFKPAGWFSKDLHRIDGFIYNRQKRKLRFLYGKWTDYLKSAKVEAYEEYIRTHPTKFCPPDRSETENVKNTPLLNSASTSSPTHNPKKMVSKLNSFKKSLTGNGSGGKESDNKSSSLTSMPVGDDANDKLPTTDSSWSLDIPNSTILWQVDQRPEYCSEYYHFTLFAMALNELNDDMKHQLPLTDSRLRPDIRKLELGDIDGAAYEKNRIEEKQREARKQRKKQKQSTWEPRWFKQEENPYTGTNYWIYTGGYWEREFSHCPDIF